MNESNRENLLLKEIETLKAEIKLLKELANNVLASQVQKVEYHWLSIDDLVKYLPNSISKATVYGWVSQDVIPHHKIGKKLTFLKSEIDSWVLNNGEIRNNRKILS